MKIKADKFTGNPRKVYKIAPDGKDIIPADVDNNVYKLARIVEELAESISDNMDYTYDPRDFVGLTR